MQSKVRRIKLKQLSFYEAKNRGHHVWIQIAKGLKEINVNFNLFSDGYIGFIFWGKVENCK